MKIWTVVHGGKDIVEGYLDLGNVPVPQPGWAIAFDNLEAIVTKVVLQVDEEDPRDHELGMSVVIDDTWKGSSGSELVEAVGDALKYVKVGDLCFCPFCHTAVSEQPS